MTMRLLNLGCGSRWHPDWTNLDRVAAGPGVLAHDLRLGIPFPDGHFDAVYHAHLLEHLAPETDGRGAEPVARDLRARAGGGRGA
jgi:predicted SAM-dependent methyltransferase